MSIGFLKIIQVFSGCFPPSENLRENALYIIKSKNAAPIRPEPRQRPRRPGGTRRRSAGKEKAADPGAGDRQLCHSRRPSPESRKVVRAKVVKSLGIVVSHSRKSRESRSVLRVIVAGRTHYIFKVLLLQVLGGNLISELLVGC